MWASVDEHLDSVAAYREKLDVEEGARGVLAVWDGQVVGLDLFDEPETFAKLWPRLADAYLVQAVAESSRPGAAETPPAGEDEPLGRDRVAAATFFATVTERLAAAPSQPDLGFEMELEGDDLAGAGVWHDGAICHLAAFAVEAEG